MPAEQAVLVAQRLGLDLSRCGLHQEATAKVSKPRSVAARFVGQLDTREQIQQIARSAAEGPPVQPFTLVPFEAALILAAGRHVVKFRPQ